MFQFDLHSDGGQRQSLCVILFCCVTTRVKHFLDTNVDLLEVQQPIDVMFDVTEYRADKQVLAGSKATKHCPVNK